MKIIKFLSFIFNFLFIKNIYLSTIEEAKLTTEEKEIYSKIKDNFITYNEINEKNINIKKTISSALSDYINNIFSDEKINNKDKFRKDCEINKLKYYFNKLFIFIHEFHHALEFIERMSKMRSQKFNSYIHILNKNIETSKNPIKKNMGYLLFCSTCTEDSLEKANMIIYQMMAGIVSEIIFFNYLNERLSNSISQNKFLNLKDSIKTGKSDFNNIKTSLILLKNKYKKNYDELLEKANLENYEVFFKLDKKVTEMIKSIIDKEFYKFEDINIVYFLLNELLRKYSEEKHINRIINILDRYPFIFENEFFSQNDIIELYFNKEEVGKYKSFENDSINKRLNCEKNKLIESGELNSLKYPNIYNYYLSILTTEKYNLNHEKVFFIKSPTFENNYNLKLNQFQNQNENINNKDSLKFSFINFLQNETSNYRLQKLNLIKK